MEDEILLLKLIKNNDEIGQVEDVSRIKITSDEMCIKILDQLKSCSVLKPQQIILIDKAINVLRMTEDTEITEDQFNLLDVMQFIKLMRVLPSHMDEIQACSEYLSACIAYDIDYNQKTYEAGKKAMDALVKLMSKPHQK